MNAPLLTPVPAWSALSPEALEAQFNPRLSVPDFTRYDEPRAAINSQARDTLDAVFDVAYGEHARRRLDIYRAPPRADGRPAPAHLFFHGGYWRALDKSAFAFVAAGLVEQGITAVIANYELCPGSNLDGVVDSALAAFAWLHRQGADHGIDPARLSIGGHSAGAHLCAAILAQDWQTYAGLEQAPPLAGATLISGVFDPRPAMYTSLNAQLQLTPEVAARNNMEQRLPRLAGPVTLLVGGEEPHHWIDLTLRYGRLLQIEGYAPDIHVLKDYNHFNLLDQYLAPESVILRAVKLHAGLP